MEKQRLLPRAQWQDVKFMLRKIMDIDLQSMYVSPCRWSHGFGWIVEFKTDVDLEEMQRNIKGVMYIGPRAVHIGVFDG